MSKRTSKKPVEVPLTVRVRDAAARAVLARPADYGARNRTHAVEMALSAMHRARFPQS